MSYILRCFVAVCSLSVGYCLAYMSIANITDSFNSNINPVFVYCDEGMNLITCL